MSNTVTITRASRYGRFRPYQLRATGGFSDVYLARDNSGKIAALKVFRSLSNDSTRSMERFRREKLILERVGNRRVSRLLDADLDAMPPWIASEYIDGPTLREAVGQAGLFRYELSNCVLALLSETLADIHELGIAHRDLNPNNIILSKDGPTLVDFGSAQLLATGQANFSQLSVGTPGFISPEQLNGEPATLASDVYAFGKVASFLVAGDHSDRSQQQLAVFAPNQEKILRQCLSDDPLKRPSAKELQRMFVVDEGTLPTLKNFDFQSPELRKLPRARTSTLIAIFAACALVIGAFGVWRATSIRGVTTIDLEKRFETDHRRYQESSVDLEVRSGNFGALKSISLPINVDISREPRNFSYFDFGFLDYFIFSEEYVTNSALAIYTAPLAAAPTFDEIIREETAPYLVDLEIFGPIIYERITAFQSEFVESECALDVPKRVFVDPSRGLIRHIASSPVCFEIFDNTNVAFAIHDWYPNKNLFFEFTGFADIAVLDPVRVLDSIELRENFAIPVIQPSRTLSLSDLSVYRDGSSVIGGGDGGEKFFYSNVFVIIPPLKSLGLEIGIRDNSAALFSFTSYQQVPGKSKPKELPAGRLFASNKHQLRFDNPDTKALVLSFEIDGLTDIPPDIFVTEIINDARKGWITSQALSFGIGEASSFVDPEFQIMLPSLLESEEKNTMTLPIGDIVFPSPTDLRTTSSEELALAGFRELWSENTPYREADLPHLQVTTEQFSRQVDGSDGAFWISDQGFLSCKEPTSYSYSASRTVEWSLFTGCKIADAVQLDFYPQIQAAPIFKFVVHDGKKSDSNRTSIEFRGVFVPGHHQHLDYFKSLLIYFANLSVK